MRDKVAAKRGEGSVKSRQQRLADALSYEDAADDRYAYYIDVPYIMRAEVVLGRRFAPILASRPVANSRLVFEDQGFDHHLMRDQPIVFANVEPKRDFPFKADIALANAIRRMGMTAMSVVSIAQ